MKTMVLEASAPIDAAPLRHQDVTAPGPKLGEIRVRVEACGICRTDVHVVGGGTARGTTARNCCGWLAKSRSGPRPRASHSRMQTAHSNSLSTTR